MVGFFDVLGFSNRVENVKTEAELVEIAETIESIRKRFAFSSKDKHVKQLHRILGKRVLAFSDCVVTSVSTATNFVRQEGLYDTFGSEIVDMAYSQIQCVWDGYFLRGGVDIGYWYYDKGVLVSPAMITAYKEERDRATYPVISLSERLYKLLKNDPGRRVYSKDADPFADEYASFKYPRTQKRVHFINYLRLGAKAVDWQYDRATYEAYMAAPARGSDEREKIMEDGYLRSLVRFFQNHRALVEKAHSMAPAEVKYKYRFLADYHNKELRFFLAKRRDLRIKL